MNILSRILSMIAIAIILCPISAVRAETPKNVVAVLYFDYHGQNEELLLLRKGLAQMLISDLSINMNQPDIMIVERDRLEEVIQELELGKSKRFDQSTISKIGKLVGAKYIVFGSYLDLFGQLRLDTRLVQIETGAIIGAAKSHGKIDDFFELEQTISKEVIKVLSTTLSHTEKPVKKPTRKPAPTKSKKAKTRLNQQVILTYSRALDHKDHKRNKEAIKDLKEVRKLAPEFALAQIDLNALIE